jgi:hypothetical protein
VPLEQARAGIVTPRPARLELSDGNRLYRRDRKQSFRLNPIYSLLVSVRIDAILSSRIVMPDCAEFLQRIQRVGSETGTHFASVCRACI